jgi:Domain of unknown function (DUF4145)
VGSDGVPVPAHAIDALASAPSTAMRAAAKDLRKFNCMIDDDPELAVVLARRSLDLMVRAACHVTEIEIGTKRLETLIQELRGANVLSDLVYRHCGVIRVFGNLATHGPPSDEEGMGFQSAPGNAEAEICSRSLTSIVAWFCERIVPHAPTYGALKVIQGSAIQPEHLVAATKIDELVYPQGFRGIPEALMQWHSHNPEIFNILYDSDAAMTVGCLTVVPIRNGLYNDIRRGTVVDNVLPINQIRKFDFPDKYILYVASIVIHPSYHRSSAFLRLFDGYLLKLMDLADRGIYASEILADAITDDGRALSENLGLRRVSASYHSSQIYSGLMLPPQLRLTTPRGRKLREIYQRYHRS